MSEEFISKLVTTAGPLLGASDPCDNRFKIKLTIDRTK